MIHINFPDHQLNSNSPSFQVSGNTDDNLRFWNKCRFLLHRKKQPSYMRKHKQVAAICRRRRHRRLHFLLAQFGACFVRWCPAVVTQQKLPHLSANRGLDALHHQPISALVNRQVGRFLGWQRTRSSSRRAMRKIYCMTPTQYGER